MTTKYALGMEGQQAAEAFLRQKGYRIRHRNYRVQSGEIDLVAQHNEYIVFIEVKTRHGLGHGLPRESVGHGKQRRITKTALFYINQFALPDSQDFRFDVVEVLFIGKECQINHIENAFDAVF